MLCFRALLQNNQLLFLWVFLSASAFLSVCLWPSLPSLRGTVGLIDNFICSWREEGDEYMTYPFCVEGRGSVFWTHLWLSSRMSCFQQWQMISFFFKTLGRSLRSWDSRGLLSHKSSCAPVRWCLYPGHLLFSSVQIGPIVPFTAGWFSAYFGHDCRLLYLVWVISTAAVPFP